jgi:hypothetical protein
MQKRSRHDQIDKHKQKQKRHNKEELDDADERRKILRQHHEMTFESSDSISVEKLSDHQAVASRRFTVSLWIRLVIKNL